MLFLNYFVQKFSLHWTDLVLGISFIFFTTALIRFFRNKSNNVKATSDEHEVIAHCQKPSPALSSEMDVKCDETIVQTEGSSLEIPLSPTTESVLPITNGEMQTGEKGIHPSPEVDEPKVQAYCSFYDISESDY